MCFTSPLSMLRCLKKQCERGRGKQDYFARCLCRKCALQWTLARVQQWQRSWRLLHADLGLACPTASVCTFCPHCSPSFTELCLALVREQDCANKEITGAVMGMRHLGRDLGSCWYLPRPENWGEHCVPMCPSRGLRRKQTPAHNIPATAVSMHNSKGCG